MLERGTTQTADQGPQDDAQWQRKWDRRDSRDVGLEAATISKVRNSLPVEPSRAENDGDSSVVPQSRIPQGRRHSIRKSVAVPAPKSSLGTTARPVPQSDTGVLGEYPKAFGRTLVKELGKMTPYPRYKGCSSGDR